MSTYNVTHIAGMGMYLDTCIGDTFVSLSVSPKLLYKSIEYRYRLAQFFINVSISNR